MSSIKDDTYCAICHWQYQRHFGLGVDDECPDPNGNQYEVPQSYFEVSVACEAESAEPLPIHGAVEATDAVEEPFDTYRAWRIQKVGILCIIILGIVCSMLIGIYIGHFVWQAT